MLATAERMCFVALWALALPLVGYSFLVVLTAGIAGFGLLLGVKTLVMMTYALGFIPTVVTASLYEFALRDRALALSLPAACLTGVVSAWAWWSILGFEKFGPNYFSFALFTATALSVGLMPFVARAWDERIAQRPSVTIR